MKEPPLPKATARDALFLACALVAVIAVAAAAPAAAQEAADTDDAPPVLELDVDPERPEATFDGVGAVSAGASSRLLMDYPAPIRSKLLDYLFKPQYGAGFDHLKVEIGGGINSTDGAEPSHMRRRGEADYTRGYEWELMKEAKKRNPDITLGALPWGAPGWVGDGDFFTKDGAEYVASFVEGAREEHGLELDYVGILNEHDLRVPYIKTLRQTLDERGLEDVQIVANDPHASMDYWKIADSMRTDPALREAVDVIGVHYPREETSANALRLQEQGVDLWSSEDHYGGGATLNENFVKRHLTKTEFWSPITSYYDVLTAPESGLIEANTPWSGFFDVKPALWAVAHTTQFTEPGWRYLEGGNEPLPAGGSVVSLTSPDREELSFIVETQEASEEQTLRVTLPPAFHGATFRVWRSDRLEQFVQAAPRTPEDGALTLTLDSQSNYSITTTTGQQKGAFTSPAPEAFPLPYREDFESDPPGETPKYLADLYGAFEVEQGADGNRYLRQQLTEPGILWLGRIPDSKAQSAFTVIGDGGWNDVEVSVEARLERTADGGEAMSERYVSLITRYYPKNFDNFVEPYPVGYTVRLFGDGRWTVTTAAEVIAEGRTAPLGHEWHDLTMRSRGNTLRVTVDGEELVALEDATYRQGLVGLGSDLSPAAFDDLAIRSAYAPSP
jgi:galactosylceramidase